MEQPSTTGSSIDTGDAASNTATDAGYSQTDMGKEGADPAMPVPEHRQMQEHLPQQGEIEEWVPPMRTLSPNPSMDNQMARTLEEDELPRICRRFKTGDHSITTTGQYDKMIYTLTPSGEYPDYCRVGSSVVASRGVNFTYSNLTYRVESRLLPAACSGSLDAGKRRTAVVQTYRNDELPEGTNHMKVMFTSAMQVGTIDPAQLTPWMISNVPNGRAVSSVVSPYLGVTNTALAANLSDALLNNLIFHDNSALYAKLHYFALLTDLNLHAGINTTARAFPQGVPVTWMNLRGANADAQAVNAKVAAGEIIFVYNKDIEMGDLMYIYSLAAAGMRLTTAANVSKPDAQYVEWDAIPITILATEDAPVAPPATAPPAECWAAFAQKLATARAEWKDNCMGLYMAMDLVGLRYVNIGTAARAEWVPITNQFNLDHYHVHRPTDYNYMLRIFHIMPEYDETYRLEIQAFTTQPRQVRVNIALLFNAMISAFTTTYLYSLSLTKKDLAVWVTGNQQDVACLLTVFGDGITMPSPASQSKECMIYAIPAAAIKAYVGFTVMQGIHHQDTWLGSVGAYAHRVGAIPGNDTEPPRFGTVLAIDTFCLARPLEWAVLGPRPSIDASHDLTFSRNEAQRGVYTYQGESAYSQAATGPQPYTFIPYGVQMVNAINQYARSEQGLVSYCYCQWDFSGNARWSQPQPYDHISFDEELHIIEPCSLVQYDWSHRKVRAPVITGPQLSESVAMVISSWRGQAIDFVGFLVSPALGINTVPMRMPVMLSAVSLQQPATGKAGQPENSQPPGNA